MKDVAPCYTHGKVELEIIDGKSELVSLGET